MRGVGGLYEHRSDGSATRMGFGKLQIEDTPANDDHRSVYVTIKKKEHIHIFNLHHPSAFLDRAPSQMALVKCDGLVDVNEIRYK